MVARDLSAIQGSADRAPAKQILQQNLSNSSRYSVSTWYPEEFERKESSYILDFGGVEEHKIRPAAMAAFGLAVTLQTDALCQRHRRPKKPPEWP